LPEWLPVVAIPEKLDVSSVRHNVTRTLTGVAVLAEVRNPELVKPQLDFSRLGQAKSSQESTRYPMPTPSISVGKGIHMTAGADIKRIADDCGCGKDRFT
jgi:hypothetical protein